MSRSNPLNSFIRTRCGASGPRGDGAGPTAPGARRCQKWEVWEGGTVLSAASRLELFVHAQQRAALAAVLPQGMPPRMRCASFNVDLPRSYFESTRQQHNWAIAEILNQVDLLALQEVGTWDKPLEKEPSRRSTVGRSGT